MNSLNSIVPDLSSSKTWMLAHVHRRSRSHAVPPDHSFRLRDPARAWVIGRTQTHPDKRHPSAAQLSRTRSRRPEHPLGRISTSTRDETHIEDIVCKLARVSEREELAVDLLKLVLVQLARRAVLQEALVLNVSMPALPIATPSLGSRGRSPIAEVPGCQLLLNIAYQRIWGRFTQRQDHDHGVGEGLGD